MPAVILRYARLFRVRQYSKNLFILMPLFFAAKFTDFNLLAKSVEAFVLFCLLASAVYILNDLFDRESDRKHPEKKKRPIPSGAVGTVEASVTAGVLGALSLGLAWFWSTSLFLWFFFYLAVNVLYSLWLKHLPLIDIHIIALGFVVRLYVGKAVTGLALSYWIILMTFLLMLFLAMAKRRDDVRVLKSLGRLSRPAVTGYNMEFITGGMILMATATFVSYVMYTISPEIVQKYGQRTLLSAPLLLFGILRYLQITLVFNQSASPAEVLLRDRIIQLALLAFFGYYALIIYLHPSS